MPAKCTTYDQAAALWVVKHYPGALPVLGTVSFDMDAAAYASAAWAHFEVSWDDVVLYPFWTGHVELGAERREEVIDEHAWKYDASDLMRELFEIAEEGSGDDEGSAPDQSQPAAGAGH